MERFTLVLSLLELVAIIVLSVTLARIRWALRNHVRKLKKMIGSLKENIEGQIDKAARSSQEKMLV